MYTIYSANENSWIFIEEPELNLHPGLQRVFMEQLSKSSVVKDKKLKIFFTTHSNHLLDLSIELDLNVSVFHFEKKDSEANKSFFIKNVLSSDVSILKGLGIRNSSVFLSNCTIWVEGVTDRIYIKSFLKALWESSEEKHKPFKEDINFSFLEYSGSNLSHYIFSDSDIDANEIKAKFISNNIFLIADRDSGKEKKHNRFLSQKREGFRYRVLDVLEIENLLSPVQLKQYLPELLAKNKTAVEELKIINFDHGEYKSKGLGVYLSEKIKLQENFKAKSGTLTTYYKNKLSEIINEKINWEEMSEDAQKLTKEIHEFIKKSNT